MHEINLLSSNIPLIREIGHMKDIDGTYKHPDRLMENFNVFVYVKRGNLQVIEDEIEYRLHGGTYLFLRKNIHHWGTIPYSPNSEWFYIHFYDSLNQNNSDEPTEYTHYQQSSLILEEAYMSHIKLPKRGGVLNREYTELQLKKLVEDYSSPHPMRPLYLSVLTFQFFLDLYADKLEETQNSKHHRIVGKIINILTTTTSIKLSSKEIASSLGMNYAYLSSLFRKETGKSITQFKNELLIEKAITKLKNEAVNISEVSDDLGFSNPFYFSRVFKKVTGVSPTTYLNEIYRK